MLLKITFNHLFLFCIKCGQSWAVLKGLRCVILIRKSLEATIKIGSHKKGGLAVYIPKIAYFNVTVSSLQQLLFIFIKQYHTRWKLIEMTLNIHICSRYWQCPHRLNDHEKLKSLRLNRNFLMFPFYTTCRHRWRNWLNSNY